MNKKILTAGAASAVLAAVPVVGAFAVDSQTDEVKVTVTESCTFTVTGEGVGTAVTITNGEKNENIPGSTMTISCNDNGGWNLSAIGGDGSGTADTTMTGGTGTAIPTGTTLDGMTSAWAFKLTGDTVEEAYKGDGSTWVAIPGGEEATKVASSTTTSANAVITATYGVSISPTQASGTYTGKVTYTLTHPAAS